MFIPNLKQISTVEYFPPDKVARWGDRAWFLTPEIFTFTLQQLRNRFGRMIINQPRNNRTQRGMRTAQFHLDGAGDLNNPENVLNAYKAYDRSDSLHKYANAADITFLDVALEYVHQYIKDNPDEFPFMSFVETGITWFHFDCRNQEGITFWNLNTGLVEEVIPQKPVRWDEFLEWHLDKPTTGKELSHYTNVELLKELEKRLGG